MYTLLSNIQAFCFNCMSLQETEISAMNLALFFFTLFSLIGAYHARHLHGMPEVIQMVTGEEESQPPPLPSLQPYSSHEQTVYGEENLDARPSPKGPLPGGETIYGGGDPNSNSPTLYAGVGVAKKRLADFLALLIPSYDEIVYGRDYLNAQPSAKGGGTEGEAVYGRDNLKAPPSLKPYSLKDRTTYDPDAPTMPPSPDPNEGGHP